MPMGITITAQSAITVAAVIGAIVAIYKYLAEAVHWMDKTKQQEEQICALKAEVKEKDIALRALISSAQQAEQDSIESFKKGVNEELTLMNFAILACLKGLREQGCDGAVTEAIDKLEKHLNVNAHK